MPPILAIMAVGFGQLDQMGSARENGVETALQNESPRRANRSMDREFRRRLRNVLAIDEDLLLAELEEDLIAWDGEDPENFFLGEGQEADGLDLALEHRWAQVSRSTISISAMASSASCSKVLLEDRNRAWAEWLDERPTCRDGSGRGRRGHFFGPKSVQVLAERGLASERLDDLDDELT